MMGDVANRAPKVMSFRRRTAPSPTADTCKEIDGIYKLKETLGVGRHGEVKKATHILTGRDVAIKFISRDDYAGDDSAKWSEVAALKRLHHPHVVRLYDVITTSSNVLLVLECLSGGELFDYLVSRRRLSEQETRRFVKQILRALDYCHKQGIVHRDLKLENLLLSDPDTIKITDFGFSNLFLEGGLMSTFVGSPAYAAPEILANEKYIGPKVDIWSLGVIVYTLLTGEMPFQDDNVALILAQINRGDFEIPDTISSSAADLIRGLLRRNPEERLTMQEIRAHPWLSEGSDVQEESDDDNNDEALKAKLHRECLQRLQAKSLNTKQLQMDLENGTMTRDTASYHIMLDQLYEEQQKRAADDEIARIIASLPASAAGGRRNSPFFMLGGSGGSNSSAVTQSSDDTSMHPSSPLRGLSPVSQIKTAKHRTSGHTLDHRPGSAQSATADCGRRRLSGHPGGAKTLSRESSDSSDDGQPPLQLTSSAPGSAADLLAHTTTTPMASPVSLASTTDRERRPRRISTFADTVVSEEVVADSSELFEAVRGASETSMSVFSAQNSREALLQSGDSSSSVPTSPCSPFATRISFSADRPISPARGSNLRVALHTATTGATGPSAANGSQSPLHHQSPHLHPHQQHHHHHHHPHHHHGHHHHYGRSSGRSSLCSSPTASLSSMTCPSVPTISEAPGAETAAEAEELDGSACAQQSIQPPTKAALEPVKIAVPPWRADLTATRERCSSLDGPSAGALRQRRRRVSHKITTLATEPVTTLSDIDLPVSPRRLSNNAHGPLSPLASSGLASASYSKHARFGRAFSLDEQSSQGPSGAAMAAQLVHTTAGHDSEGTGSSGLQAVAEQSSIVRPRSRSVSVTVPAARLSAVRPAGAKSPASNLRSKGLPQPKPLAEIEDKSDSALSDSVGALDLATGLSSFGAATTSVKTVSEIMAELKRALKQEGLEFEVVGRKGSAIVCHGSSGDSSPATRRRSMRATHDSQEVVWEMSVSHLEKLGLRGIRLKRIAGNHWDYKRLVDRVIGRCHL